MVKPEAYTTKTREWNRAIAMSEFKADILSMERAANGSWYVTIAADVAVTMRDGRKVRTTQELRIKAIQSGRVPHPNSFGRGGGRKNR